MVDKLDWLNQHFVLLLHKDVDSVISNEGYNLPFELRELHDNYPLSDDFIKQLALDENYKQASEFLSFNLHHRALAWWAYCVVLSLRKELKNNPPVEKDIADIGKPKEVKVPDWAKNPPTDLPEFQELEKVAAKNPQRDVRNTEEYAQLQAAIDKCRARNEELKKQLPPGLWDRHEALKKEIYAKFKEIVGKDPQELLEFAIDKAVNAPDLPNIDMQKSPAARAAKAIRDKIEIARLEAIAKIKSAVKFKSKAQIEEETVNAMDAAYAYIVAPTDENAKRCLDVGNLCPDKPEGLLALVCFWSFGNMLPLSDNVVRTPPAVLGNGMKSLLLMCSLAKGGERSLKDREKLYFEIGKEVAFGINNWSEHMPNKDAPHDTISDSESFDGRVGSKSEENERKDGEITSPNTQSEYIRFKG